MQERPILFSAPMIQAILAGRKYQTRRIAKGITEETCYVGLEGHSSFIPVHDDGKETPIRCPYGVPGDRLWVRENFCLGRDMTDTPIMATEPNMGEFIAMHPDAPEGSKSWCLQWKNKPSIHMPRWASRITLEITGVRVERLQEITEADAVAEGIEMPDGGKDSPGWWSYVKEYEFLWNRINGEGSWDDNPFVWVLEFRRVTMYGLCQPQ